jgi:hypothetical protein
VSNTGDLLKPGFAEDQLKSERIAGNPFIPFLLERMGRFRTLYDEKTKGLPSGIIRLEGAPEFLNSKAGEILSTSPNTLQVFFNIHRTCGRVSTPYRISLSARGIYAPAHKGWMTGAVQNTLTATTGV